MLMYWTPRTIAGYRREHAEVEALIVEEHGAQSAFQEDGVAVNCALIAARVRCEVAEADLATARHQYEIVTADWHRKLHDRRKEVRCAALPQLSYLPPPISCGLQA